MDATDNELVETQYYGCCVVDLYNGHRAHAGLDGRTPEPSPDAAASGHDGQLVSMAAALSWAVSDADGGVTRVRSCGPRQTWLCVRVERSNAAVPSVLRGLTGRERVEYHPRCYSVRSGLITAPIGKPPRKTWRACRRVRRRAFDLSTERRSRSDSVLADDVSTRVSQSS